MWLLIRRASVFSSAMVILIVDDDIHEMKQDVELNCSRERMIEPGCCTYIAVQSSCKEQN